MNKLKTAGKNRILLIAVIALAVLLVINVLTLVIRIYDSSYTYGLNDMLRAVEDRDYQDLSFMLSQNEKSFKKSKDDLSEFSLLLEYYKAANMYDCYALAGDTDMADQQLRLMNDLESRMADCSSEVLAAAEELRSMYNGVK